MERDNKIKFAGVYALAIPAFRVFNRLLAGHRNAGPLVAAAREISYAANRQNGTHAALKQAADRIYRKHGILTTPLWQGEGIKPTLTEDGEVSVEECSAFRRSPTGIRRTSRRNTTLRCLCEGGFRSIRRAASTLSNLVLDARRQGQAVEENRLKWKNSPY